MANNPNTNPGGFDCKQDDSGEYGFCQFANPAGGRWFVMIDRVEGSGEYQITMNDRNTQPPVCGNDLHEPGEGCDGTDDDSCPGLCLGSCQCPAPACGNGVQESGEDCDVGMDAACPGRCNVQCGCDCVEDDLVVSRVLADAKRLVAERERQHFRAVGDVARIIPGASFDLTTSSVDTHYFEVRGRLRIDDVVIEERSMVQRTGRTVRTLQRERGTFQPLVQAPR